MRLCHFPQLFELKAEKDKYADNKAKNAHTTTYPLQFPLVI